jgi:hypothetical protein
MIDLVKRMATLRMTPAALARRSRLNAEVVAAVLASSAEAAPDVIARVHHCLGVGPDGHRLVPTRTFRKQAARTKARFIVSMVQGTMGLEAQGLTPADRQRLFLRTYRRLKTNPANIW